MNHPLTPAERSAIREREQAAHLGPWTVNRRWSNGCEIIPLIHCAKSESRPCGWIAELPGAPYLGYEDTLPNAEFIAAAREDVPRLLDDLDAADERLQAAVAAEREACISVLNAELSTRHRESMVSVIIRELVRKIRSQP